MKKTLTVLLMAIVLPLTWCSNVFSSLAKKDTDEALLEDARNLMNDTDWDGALSKFEALSSDYKARPDIVEEWSYAYAGKCGLNFIEYFGNLGDASLGGATIFKFLMNAWQDTAISADHCTLAQEKMEEISDDPALRNEKQNLFMAILGLVKMGVYLQAYADRDKDGAAEVDVCTDDASNFPKAALNEFITGMGLFTSNLIYLTAVLSDGDITDAFETIDTACQMSPGACGKTDPTTITDGDRDLFRDLLATSSSNPTAPLGVGACNNNLVVPCCL